MDKDTKHMLIFFSAVLVAIIITIYAHKDATKRCGENNFSYNTITKVYECH